MITDFTVANHQDVIAIPADWITVLEEVAPQIVALALSHATSPDCPLASLEALEVSLVDDPTSAQVHLDFMGLDDPTDVITFHHGEIVIGASVAQRQAQEYTEPFGRELLRYLVHGVLHLAGHEDAAPAERAAMERCQEEIVARLWEDELAEKLV